MEIHTLANRLLKLSQQYTHRYSIERSPQWCLLKLNEEVGELVQAYLKSTGQTRSNSSSQIELEDELADVLGMVLILVRELDVDIERGLERKWFRHEADNEKALAELNP